MGTPDSPIDRAIMLLDLMIPALEHLSVWAEDNHNKLQAEQLTAAYCAALEVKGIMEGFDESARGA